MTNFELIISVFPNNWNFIRHDYKLKNDMKRIWLCVVIFVAVSVTNPAQPQKPLFLTDYVNPFIGSGGHGHTFPGVSVPFGMVQLSPDTRLDGLSLIHI